MRKPSASALIAAAAAVIGLYAVTTTNSAAEIPFAALTPGADAGVPTSGSVDGVGAGP